MANLKIKCPGCGKGLIIANQPGIEKKTFTCPVCKTRSIIGPNIVVEKPKPVYSGGEETQYSSSFHGSTGEETQYSSSGIYNKENIVFDSEPATIQEPAQLVDNFGRSYPLKVGINTIGRKAKDSTASIQIPVEDRTMSREHAKIEVINSDGQLTYILKNWKNKNPSCLNGTLIGKLDQLVLNNGDCIKLSNTELIFKK